MENKDVKTSRYITPLRTLLRGSSEVMLQANAWSGLLFLMGIFWGAYQEGQSAVAWGAVVGLIVSTVTGYLLHQSSDEGQEGLWGFNGILVGCAFPTFLGNTPAMWVALILCAMLTTPVRRGLNKAMAQWHINSLTFPFVLLTWIFLLSARLLQAMPPEYMAHPELVAPLGDAVAVDSISLLVYWLKGIAQVFLIDSWVTGIFFLAALLIANRWAALWAAVASVIALLLALLYDAPAHNVANGLYGFSPVLTGIALGATFYKPNLRSAMWTLLGVITTFFVQAGMDALMLPLGLPTLTAPFCLTTWLFLLPLYKFDDRKPNHSNWHKSRINTNPNSR